MPRSAKKKPVERQLPKRYTLAEWRAEAGLRFGPDPRDWRFRCVSCGHVQSIASILEHTPDRDRELVGNQVAFSCEGRWVKGVGCDWTLGGLFTIHKVEVVMEDGAICPSFEFADDDTDTDTDAPSAQPEA